VLLKEGWRRSLLSDKKVLDVPHGHHREEEEEAAGQFP
jgi:hypothetical protein